MNSTMRRLLTRLLSGLVVLWASVTLLFVVFHTLPGSTADAVLSGDRVVSDAVRARTIQQLGLDRPVLTQYVDYWVGLLHGDFGHSFVNDRSVGEILRSSAPASLRLAFWALLLEVFICVAVAVLVYSRARFQTLANWTSVLMIGVPAFVLGYVLQLVVGVYPAQHGWPSWTLLPVQGIGPDSWWLVIPLGEQWRYLLLPVVTLAIVSAAVAYRVLQSSIRSAVREPHVVGARARGLSESVIFRRHVLRNALVPTVTFIGADLATLFGAAVLTEAIFNWPGIGSVIATAMMRRDVPVVLGASILLAVGYVVANAVVDLLYQVIDPRLRKRVA